MKSDRNILRIYLKLLLLLALLLSACSADEISQVKPEDQIQESEAEQAEQTPLNPQPSSTPESTIEPSFPLSDPGPYQVGIRHMISFIDANRDDREVTLTIWYPAENPQDSDVEGPTKDAPVLVGDAPYPLVMSSRKTGAIFANTLASYGFVVVGINKIDAYAEWDQNIVDQPLDFLFALEELRSSPPQFLEGVIDSERVGAMGYSFDGYNALALSGARIDPEYFLNDCSNPPENELPLLAWTREYQCPLAASWEELTEHAGTGLTNAEDGLWQPMTDPGVIAVMPMAPEGLRLFGTRGLEAADRAVLIIGSENDELYPEDIQIFDRLGSEEKSLITFPERDHMMIFNQEMCKRMAHFAVAFFGTHLQGNSEWQYYYSQEFVTEQGLVWGPYLTE